MKFRYLIISLAALLASPAFGQSVWPANKVQFSDTDTLEAERDRHRVFAFGSLPTCDGAAFGNVFIVNNSSSTGACNGSGSANAECLCDGSAYVSLSGGGGGGTSVALDIGSDGDDSAAIVRISTSGDTENIFTETPADELDIDVSKRWPTSTVALAINLSGGNAAAGINDDQAIVGTALNNAVFRTLQQCNATTGKFNFDGNNFICDTDQTGGGVHPIAAGDFVANAIDGDDVNGNIAGSGLQYDTSTSPNSLATQSDEDGFLVDLGGATLSCGVSGNEGRMSVNDGAALEYCDGQSTPQLRRAAFGALGGGALSLATDALAQLADITAALRTGTAGPDIVTGDAGGTGTCAEWDANGDLIEAASAAPCGSGGSVASDGIWDAKGDLAVATTDDTAIRLAVGANEEVLVADSGEPTGLIYKLLRNASIDSLAAISGSKLQDASNSNEGSVQIATQSEVNSGTNGVRPVVPDTLENRLLDNDLGGTIGAPLVVAMQNDAVGQIGDIAAAIKGDDADSKLATTSAAGPTPNECVEMDSSGSLVLAGDTCSNLGPGGTPTQIVDGDSNVTVADAGAGTVTATIDGTAIGIWDIGGLTIGGADPTNQLILPASDDAVTPTLAFGAAGDSGFYQNAVNETSLSHGGARKWRWTNSFFEADLAAGPRMSRTNGGLNVASFNPFKTDINTGLGADNDDKVSLVAGANAGLEVHEGSSGMSANDTLLFIPDLVTPPTANPTGGVFLYSDLDTLKTRDTAGNVSDIETTFEALSANGDIGFGASQVPEGDEVAALAGADFTGPVTTDDLQVNGHFSGGAVVQFPGTVAEPTVTGGMYFKTAAVLPASYTDFVGTLVDGQLIIIQAVGDAVIDCSLESKIICGMGGLHDLTMDDGDVMALLYNGTAWSVMSWGQSHINTDQCAITIKDPTTADDIPCMRVPQNAVYDPYNITCITWGAVTPDIDIDLRESLANLTFGTVNGSISITANKSSVSDPAAGGTTQGEFQYYVFDITAIVTAPDYLTCFADFIVTVE